MKPVFALCDRDLDGLISRVDIHEILEIFVEKPIEEAVMDDIWAAINPNWGHKDHVTFNGQGSCFLAVTCFFA